MIRFILATLISLFAILNCSFADEFKNIKRHDFVFLMDYDTKEVLLSKNSDTRLAPSSMTKLMTAYVVADQIKKGKVSLENECIIGRDAWRKRGSSMFLNYGDIVSIDKLLKGLLAVSGNDAAVALAQSVGGSKENFVAMMNFKAKELGLKNSQFRNPHGLNQDGHYMSLRDLATLLANFYENFPEFASYLSIEKFTYANITQPNRNPLMKTHYDGIVAGKTGYTSDGGYGVIASVKRGDRRLIAAINKGKTSRHRTKLITEVFDYGFEEYNKLTIFHRNQNVATLDSWLGDKKVKLSPKQEIAFNIPRAINQEAIDVKVNYQAPIYAPVRKGDKIAELKVKIKNYKTLTYPLFATNNVKKAKPMTALKEKFGYKIKNIAYRLKYKLRRIASKAKKFLAKIDNKNYQNS